MKTYSHTYEVLPLGEQRGPLHVSQSTCSNTTENELTWPTPISLQLELDVPTSEHDVLEKVDLLGCAKWDPEDQQEVRKILREYADIFAKDDLNLG